MPTAEPLPYADGPTKLSGLMFRPVGPPRAAVAVFPTIKNTTPAVEAKARLLAEAGYLACIGDFYGVMPAGMEDAYRLSQALTQDPAVYRARLRAALAALRAVAPDLPLAAIGFCIGGQAALELARDGADLVLAASFHGLLETKAPALPGAIKARILVCHGDADPLVPRDHVRRFWEEMDQAGVNWHFHCYGGVKHSFTNPNPPADNPALAYDASADRQSWTALLSLLDEILD
ncbi:MAG TPA: dienelactone hydrolase family protein [Qipengyuania sp.]|nr:dienelactone hydrolase family protein [Qipengyuania sp.]